eukprot:6315958-Prymnesium_polylepis.1
MALSLALDEFKDKLLQEEDRRKLLTAAPELCALCAGHLRPGVRGMVRKRAFVSSWWVWRGRERAHLSQPRATGTRPISN